MVVKERLMLRVEFEALILEVVSLLEYGLKLDGQRVVNEVVFNSGLEFL